MSDLFYVGIYCDHPECEEEHRHDIKANSLEHAYQRARVYGMEQGGWSRVREGQVWKDYCPTHTAAVPAATTPKEPTHAH